MGLMVRGWLCAVLRERKCDEARRGKLTIMRAGLGAMLSVRRAKDTARCIIHPATFFGALLSILTRTCIYYLQDVNQVRRRVRVDMS